MKTIQYIKTGCIVALLQVITVLTATAQEETTNYMNREMTLERQYDPSVQDANKVNTLPQIKEPEVRKIPIDYSTLTIPAFPGNEVSRLASGRILTDMEYNKRRGYLNLAGGTYMNINGDLGYHILSSDKDQLGIFFSHRSSNGKVEYLEAWNGVDKKVKAKLNDNLGGIDYRHIFEGATMNLGGTYNYTAFNYYGLPGSFRYVIPTVTGTSTDNSQIDRETNQVNQAIRINAGVRSHENASVIGYNVLLDYTNFSQKYGFSKEIDGPKEHTVHGLVDINTSIGTSQKVGATADLNYYAYSSPKELEDLFENRMTGTVSPYYRIEGGSWRVQLGANVMFVTGANDKVFFSPNVKANVEIANKTVLYAKAGGEVKNNGSYDLSRMNRLATLFYLQKASRSWLDACIGVKSGVAPGFWFDVFGGYKITDDELFFMPSSTHTQPFTHAVNVLPLDAKHLFVGASLKYAYLDFLELTLKGVYNNWDVELAILKENYRPDPEAYGKPEMEIEAGIKVRPIDKLTLAADYYLQTGRPIYYGANEKMKNINELNVTASYSFNDTFGFYVKLNNVLFQKYEIYYGYPMQGFNAILGINLNF